MQIEHRVRRITHTVFEVSVPPEFVDLSLALANSFLQWITSQTDLYMRSIPEVRGYNPDGTVIITFRAGLDRNPDQVLPGSVYPSSTAYEELVTLEPGEISPFPPEKYTKQEGGNHYLTMPIQPWEIIGANGLNYYEGCALKYIMRRKEGQNRVTELKKAIHYLEHLIQLEEASKK